MKIDTQFVSSNESSLGGTEGMEADMVQFMLLTPLPVTALYQDHKERGLLREDLPFEEWHGQKYLTYRHPEFPGNSAEKWLMAAFRKDYEVNSSSMYRVVETVFRGYRRLAGLSRRDTCLETRMEQFRRRSIEYAGILPLVAKYAVNETERIRATVLDRDMTAFFGNTTFKERLRRLAIQVLAVRWKLKCDFFGDGIQPPTIVTRYGAGANKFVPASSRSAFLNRVADTLAGYLSPPRPADISSDLQSGRRKLDCRFEESCVRD